MKSIVNSFNMYLLLFPAQHLFLIIALFCLWGSTSSQLSTKVVGQSQTHFLGAYDSDLNNQSATPFRSPRPSQWHSTWDSY